MAPGSSSATSRIAAPERKPARGRSIISANSKHVFLDLDGTLTDPGEGIIACLRYAATALGVEISGNPGRFVGPPLRQAFGEILRSRDPAYVEKAIALYRERFTSTGIFENALYPGIPEALGDLQAAGHRMAVVTAKPQVFATRIIEHFELTQYFDGVYGPDLAGHPSSKVDLLAQVLVQERAEAANSIMVGDRSYDMEAARVNRVTAVGVGWGYGTSDELVASGADTVIASVGTLVQTISDITTG